MLLPFYMYIWLQLSKGWIVPTQKSWDISTPKTYWGVQGIVVYRMGDSIHPLHNGRRVRQTTWIEVYCLTKNVITRSGLECGASANLYTIIALPRCSEAPMFFWAPEGFFLREGTHPIHDDVTLYYHTIVCNYSSYVISHWSLQSINFNKDMLGCNHIFFLILMDCVLMLFT